MFVFCYCFWFICPDDVEICLMSSDMLLKVNNIMFLS